MPGGAGRALVPGGGNDREGFLTDIGPHPRSYQNPTAPLWKTHNLPTQFPKVFQYPNPIPHPNA